MRRLLAGAVLVLTTFATACAPEGQLFRVDERVSITAPEDRSEVTLPLTITWEVDGFEIRGPGAPASADAGYFAVFLDRSPVPPGERVVEARDVFTTTRTSLLIEELPGDEEEQHTATIVLVDTAGTRIGESAWGVAFDVIVPGEGRS